MQLSIYTIVNAWMGIFVGKYFRVSSTTANAPSFLYYLHNVYNRVVAVYATNTVVIVYDPGCAVLSPDIA